MKARLPVMTLLVALWAWPAAAHEDAVYESLGHIPIGRIFLTPDERERLDQRRGREPVRSSSPGPAADRPERLASSDAAGFIVSDSGTTRVWKDGDFVTVSSVSDVRFPGQVRVDSQSAPRNHDDDAEANEEATAPAGAGDDDE